MKKELTKFTLRISIYIYFIFFLLSCSSPLEDVEITEFNLIRASFNITKEISSDGTVSDKIDVIMRDKNYKKLELKNVLVKVNGNKMDYDNSVLEKKYEVDIPISLNKEYLFEVVLTNGETAKAVLTTPKIDLESISYPKIFNIGENYSIYWNKGEEPVGIRFILEDKTCFDNPSYIFKREKQNNVDVFTIPGNETKNYTYGNRCSYRLTYSGKDKLPGRFRSELSTVEVVYVANDIIVAK